MKKNFIKMLFLLFIISILPLTSCKNKNDNTITIAQVTHSIFYAPLYVAKEKGYFENNGLKIEIITTPGADKVMASLLSKDADIGLMGPEATVYNYVNGNNDYAVNFAQLTQKDGSFLIGREQIENFSIDMLKGKSIIGGRKGGMPEMTLEYILKKAGLTISQDSNEFDADVLIRTDVSFDAITGVFISGNDDFATAFEPIGTNLEKEGQGYIVASIGELLNENVPYTCFSALNSYLNKNYESLSKFTKAIKEGLDFINNNPTKEIIKYLKKDFPTSSDQELTSVINNYLKIEAWPKSINFTNKSFDKLIEIIKLAGELDKNEYVPYENLVTNQFI